MPKPLCFWVCANYLAEVAAVVHQAAWPDVIVRAYPSLCQHGVTTSPQGPVTLPPPRADCGRTCLVSGCLPTRSVLGDQSQRDWQIQVVDQCFHLLAAPEWVNQLLQDGAYLVSPGWLKQWSHHLAEWGFDQATARAFFHESTRQLGLLDTGLDPRSPAQAQALADYLDLPLQIWKVGLSYLQKSLEVLYRQWLAAEAQAEANRQTADYGVAFDWLPHLAELQTEPEVAQDLAQFCAMLFAPRHVGYRPISARGQDTGIPHQTLEAPEAALAAWLRTSEPYAWTADDRGFLLRLTYQAETVGVLEIDDFAFPDYRQRYLKLALALAPVGGLAIAHARAYQALQQLNAELEQRVTDRTAELSQTNTALTRAVRVKSEFLAAMSHELRTPLAGIMGLAETLEMGIYGPLTERQAKPFDLLRADAERLLSLITDVLDYTALEADASPLRVSDTPVKEACLVSLQAVQAASEAKQVQLTFSQAPEISTLPADRSRLEQILTKLLENAIKFTPKEGTVGLKVTGDPARHEVYFTVWDTGIGITPQDQARIFEPFEQADSRLAREYEGAGLGLALVRRLVELHGGRITVESGGADRGSRFSVALPSQSPLTQ